jgi:hypothetical protein
MHIPRLKAASLFGFLLWAGAALPLPASASCDLQAVSLYTSHLAGNGPVGQEVAYTPHIGEDYRLTLEYKVVGSTAAPFKVRFRMAAQTQEIWASGLAPGTHAISCSFTTPLDGSIPFSAYLDPDHASGETPETGWFAYWNNVTLGSFSPLPPAKAIEYYAPRTMSGTQTLDLDFQTFHSLSQRVAIMAGKPDSESWQKLLSSSCKVESGLGTEWLTSVWGNIAASQVYMWDCTQLPSGHVRMTHHFQVEARNTRADADQLRTVTWSQLDALSGINYFKFYQDSDAVTESQSATIAQFVKDALGQNYRAHYTPYDAARALFQAVLKRMTYQWPSPSNTAVEAYNKQKGDCGAFSLLIVAALRNIGFPARTNCGVWEGVDLGHCWSECYFPGHGWLVSDGSAGNSYSEDGAYAYCFGNIPNLNARMATMRGNSFTADGLAASWLQSPALWWWGVGVSNVSVHTSLAAD